MSTLECIYYRSKNCPREADWVLRMKPKPCGHGYPIAGYRYEQTSFMVCDDHIAGLAHDQISRMGVVCDTCGEAYNMRDQVISLERL